MIARNAFGAQLQILWSGAGLLAVQGLAWVAFSVFIAELAGYLLHRLLHSEKIGWLSRSHMEHHLEHYGPHKPMRPSETYFDATTGRWSIGNIGMEWIVPSGVVLGGFLGIFEAINMPWSYRISFVAIALGWTSLTFNYLHDRMHIRAFWMERSPWLKKWFIAARRLHDIHHLSLNDNGRMDCNFGIGFYFLDRIFGTFCGRVRSVNRSGFEAARLRHSLLQDGDAARTENESFRVRQTLVSGEVQ